MAQQTTAKPDNPLKIKKITFTKQPLEIFSKLQKQYETTYLLESIEGPEKLAQYSFIGFDPKTTIQAKNKKVQNQKHKNRRNNHPNHKRPTPTYRTTTKMTMRSQTASFVLLEEQSATSLMMLCVTGKNFPRNRPSDMSFPDLEMGIFDDGFIFNHCQKQAFYYYRGENRLPEVEKLLNQPEEPEKLIYTQPKVNTKKENFEKAVEKAKDYVTAGDIFQVVLSKRYQLRNKRQLNSILPVSTHH